MGIQERKMREREELRSSIIAAASDLFREKGYASVSMRQIAKRIEYSVGTLYLHYRDKDELFLAVQETAFVKAFRYMQPALQREEPWDQLLTLGQLYIEFGIQNPDFYRLMFMMQHPMEALPDSEGWQSGVQLHNLLAMIVTNCIENGDLTGADVGELSFIMWSLVHGMVALRISNRIDIYNGTHIDGSTCMSNDTEAILRAFETSMQTLRRS